MGIDCYVQSNGDRVYCTQDRKVCIGVSRAIAEATEILWKSNPPICGNYVSKNTILMIFDRLTIDTDSTKSIFDVCCDIVECYLLSKSTNDLPISKPPICGYYNSKPYKKLCLEIRDLKIRSRTVNRLIPAESPNLCLVYSEYITGSDVNTLLRFWDVVVFEDTEYKILKSGAIVGRKIPISKSVKVDYWSLKRILGVTFGCQSTAARVVLGILGESTVSQTQINTSLFMCDPVKYPLEVDHLQEDLFCELQEESYIDIRGIVPKEVLDEHGISDLYKKENIYHPTRKSKHNTGLYMFTSRKYIGLYRTVSSKVHMGICFHLGDEDGTDIVILNMLPTNTKILFEYTNQTPKSSVDEMKKLIPKSTTTQRMIYDEFFRIIDIQFWAWTQ